MPPVKNGDYAFQLLIVKSLKIKAKAALILPYGVLFRGKAEAEVREILIRKGIIKVTSKRKDRHDNIKLTTKNKEVNHFDK